jgi:hypothetical protein
MPVASPIVQRPQRWDAAFDPEMSDAVVNRLLTIAPFSQMDAAKFRSARRFAARHQHPALSQGAKHRAPGDYGVGF